MSNANGGFVSVLLTHLLYFILTCVFAVSCTYLRTLHATYDPLIINCYYCKPSMYELFHHLVLLNTPLQIRTVYLQIFVLLILCT